MLAAGASGSWPGDKEWPGAFTGASSPVPAGERERGHEAPCRCDRSRFLVSDDLVLNGVISILRDDLLVHQFVLGPIGASLDDGLGPGRSDLRQLVEVILGGGVDVEQGSLGRCCGGSRRLRCGAWRRGLGEGRRGEQQAKSRKGSEMRQ